MSTEIATVYEGWTEETTPYIEDGKLVSEQHGRRTEIELEDGMKLSPGYATAAQEDHVIRIYKD